jgi:hypothetical protein
MFALLSPTMGFAVGADYGVRSMEIFPNLIVKISDFCLIFSNIPRRPFVMGNS